MFIERKEYDPKTIRYEIVDDYQTRIQLTPEQAQILLQWFNNSATQIVRDVQGDPLDQPFEELAARWKEPKTTTVYLSNGNVIETEINGKTLDGSSGYVLVNGKDVNVDLIDGRWQERTWKYVKGNNQ